MRFRLLTCIPLLTLACVCPATAAAAGWLAPTQVSESGVNTTASKLVAAGTGDLAFAYTRSVPSTNARVAVRLRPLNSALGAEQLVSGAGVSAGIPAIGAGSGGTIVVAWSDGGIAIGIARRQPGSPTFATLTTYTLPAGEFLSSIAPPVVLPSGEAAIAYSTGQGSTRRVRAIGLGPSDAAASAISGTAGGGAIDAVVVPSMSDFASVTLARPVVDSEGRVYVAWLAQQLITSGPTSDSQSARVAIRPAGGSFGAAIALGSQSSGMTGTGIAVGVPALGAGPGVVIAGWGERDAMGAQQMRFRELTGGVAAATTTSLTTTGFPSSSTIGVDQSGAVLAVWVERNTPFGGSQHVRGLIRPAGGAFPPPGVIADPGANVQLGDLAVGPNGEALIAWQRGGGFAPLWDEVSFRPAGNPFGSPEIATPPIDAAPAAPSAAFDASGVPHIGWFSAENPEAQQARALFAIRDGGLPRIDTFTVPPTALAGTQVPLTAAASDNLSPVSARWDFGDGSGAAGFSASHAYGVPGNYTVTLTVTDGAGNDSVRAAGIAITAFTPPADIKAPVITRLSLTRKRFAVSIRSTATIAAKKKKKATAKGTSFLMTLSERATVVIQLSSIVGRKVSAAGTLVRGARGPGAVSIAFSGRLDKKALLLGRYQATIRAIDAAGNRSKARRISFTVVR